MAEFVGKKICPQLIVLPLNFSKYIAKSGIIKNILMDYDPNLCVFLVHIGMDLEYKMGN